MKKVNNFQDEFSIKDIEIARDVRATYDCGMSRIALKADEQIYKIRRGLMNGSDSTSTSVNAMTLKLHYAIQVWCKALHITTDDSSKLRYYWWLSWTSDGTPFNKLKYDNFYYDITVEELLHKFWELLEQIADSGDIKVCEGYQCYYEGEDYFKPELGCAIILDRKNGKEVHNTVENVYTYPYNKELRTFKWDEIKDFFYEMTLDQLRLTKPDKLHNHTELDDILLQASDMWDTELIKLAINRGANINCLDKNGESVLQKALEYIHERGLLIEKHYSKEELKEIETTNEKKCKETVDLLLSYGADVNLYGYKGMTPLRCAYNSRSPQMVKLLLENGASPNLNSYMDELEKPENVRSMILDDIDDLIYEDYRDEEGEIERIIHDAGGRQYVWDYNPWTFGNEGKYVVHMTPSKKGDKIFTDNARWWIGTAEELVIEDKDGYQTNIALNSIEGLRQWNADFQANITNPGYDWQSWKKRGYELACQVAKLLSDKVALFYLYDNETVVQKAYWHPDHTPSPNELTLCCDGKPIRIG